MQSPPLHLPLVSLALLLPTALAQMPACTYADEPAPILGNEGLFTLVDTVYRLPEDFAPSDLVALDTLGIDDNRLLQADAAAALAELLSAASAAGVNLEVQSAYRSHSYQETVFNGWVATLGRQGALATSARPGHSEHQLGTAVDLRTAGGPPPWELVDWADTKEGAWLAANAGRFGFVMSYPRGKEEVTCYAHEPWHYRWLGEEAAAAVQASGLTLREWLWRESRGDAR